MPQSKTITSFNNPKVKNVVKLRQKNRRDQTQLMIVEGFREVLCAHESGVEIKEVFLCPDLFKKYGDQKYLRQIVKRDASLFETQNEIFSKISFGNRCEGILAICRQPQLTFKDLKLSDLPIVVIVESVEKPGNLGAILRTCDAAGVSSVIVCDQTTDIYNPNVVRASLGTIFSVGVMRSSNQEALSFLKSKHIKICVTQTEAHTVYTKADYSVPLAIVVGSEKDGLSDFWINNANMRVSVPMLGRANSLNVSTVSALLIYEVLRQRSI